MSVAAVCSLRDVAYTYSMRRLDGSDTIPGHRRISEALSVGPAKDDQERKSNSDAFESAFCEVLADASLEADAPMVTTDTTKART